MDGLSVFESTYVSVRSFFKVRDDLYTKQYSAEEVYLSCRARKVYCPLRDNGQVRDLSSTTPASLHNLICCSNSRKKVTPDWRLSDVHGDFDLSHAACLEQCHGSFVVTEADSCSPRVPICEPISRHASHIAGN